MTKNYLRGKKAQRSGDAFEKYIEASLKRYRTKGIADIKKTPEPLKAFGVLNKRRGWYKAYYEKKGQPDFLGTLKGGQSIMMEAKHTATTHIRFDRIQPHQEIDLTRTLKLGGAALVLISFNLKNFYCVDWFGWMELKENVGKKSVNEKDLAPYKVEYMNGYIHFLGEV